MFFRKNLFKSKRNIDGGSGGNGRITADAPGETPVKESTGTEDGRKENSEEYEVVEKEILPEKMICPDCGGITLVGLDFCDKCGGELGNYENY